MKNNLEYRSVIRLCLLYICFLIPPPYFAHFPLGHCFKTFTNLITQQQYQISGTVTDSYGPMPGVHVLIKGTNTGTFTDKEGEYFLLVSNKDILVFSYLGYHTRELPVLGRTNLDVQMQSEVTELQEVEVNAGYYTVKEKERTGSISRVAAAEIELQPIVSPLEALQGRMAGVEVVPNGNLPGMASTIRIRGTNSLRSEGNFPLYIIDGVPINSTPIGSNSLIGNFGPGADPLNMLNLSNIQSIEVLKDADATAIYGSRGANGVILITTKKGGQSGTKIEAQAYSGMSTVPNRVKVLDTEQYLKIRKMAFENDGIEATRFNAYDLVVWDQDRQTDWQDVFFGGVAPVTDLNMSFSGGNGSTNYSLRGSYHNQGTVFPGDYDYNKATTALNLNHVSENQKLAINLSVNYGADTNHLVGSVNLTTGGLKVPPNAPPIFNSDGSLHWEEWSDVGQNNPLMGFHNSSTTVSNHLVGNMGITYQLAKGLSLKANLGYTNFNSREVVKYPKKSYNPAWSFLEHQSEHLQFNRKSWIIEPQLLYSSKFLGGSIDALIGTTFQQSKNDNLSINASGYVSESQIGNLRAAGAVSVRSNENIDYSYHAIFARLGFNWDQQYYLNFTGRRDGSSRFGPGKRFANFGAIGGAWIFANENSKRDKASFLSFGKLRGSYGITGSDQIGDYGYLDTYEPTPGPGGLYPTQLANTDYSWEENKKLEAALDLGFLRDRINLAINWYRNRSSNQLVGYPLPAMTGFNSVQANLPATVQNTGWEVGLTTLNIKNKVIRWQTSLNISFPENKLLSYPDIEQSSHANTYRVGQPLNIALLYQYDGLDPQTGFYKMADINGDNRLDYKDRVVIKDLGRQYFGGINNSIGFKNFNLNFLWQFVKQEGSLHMFNAGNLSMQRQEVVEALEEGGKFQKVSRSIQALIAYSNAQNSSFPYTDASFIRLKTLSVGYDLPPNIIKEVGLSACQLFVNGQNLITISNYGGLDPEMPIGGTQFSALRTITCGIKLNF